MSTPPDKRNGKRSTSKQTLSVVKSRKPNSHVLPGQRSMLDFFKKKSDESKGLDSKQVMSTLSSPIAPQTFPVDPPLTDDETETFPIDSDTIDLANETIIHPNTFKKLCLFDATSNGKLKCKLHNENNWRYKKDYYCVPTISSLHHHLTDIHKINVNKDLNIKNEYSFDGTSISLTSLSTKTRNCYLQYQQTRKQNSSDQMSDESKGLDSKQVMPTLSSPIAPQTFPVDPPLTDDETETFPIDSDTIDLANETIIHPNTFKKLCLFDATSNGKLKCKLHNENNWRYEKDYYCVPTISSLHHHLTGIHNINFKEDFNIKNEYSFDGTSISLTSLSTKTRNCYLQYQQTRKQNSSDQNTVPSISTVIPQSSNSKTSTNAIPDELESNSNIFNNANTTFNFNKSLTAFTFKVLCFYDTCVIQNKEVFYCKLSHKNNRYRFIGVDHRLSKMESILCVHLRQAHHIKYSELKEKTFYQKNDIIISLDSIPSDTLTLFKKYQSRLLDQQNKHSSIEAITENTTSKNLFVNNKNLSIVSSNISERKFTPFKEAPEAIVELTIVSMLHHSFLTLANFENKLTNQLQEIGHIKAEINRVIRRSTTRNKKLTKTSCSTYFVFKKPASRSIYDLADSLPYGGFSKVFQTRKNNYKTNVTSIISKGQAPTTNSQSIHYYMAACDLRGEAFYIELSRDNMNKVEGLFTEFTMISFISALPINENKNHGTTGDFKEELKRVKKLNGEPITNEDIVKCGCGEFVRFYKTKMFDFEALKPLFEKKVPVSTNLSFDHQNFILTASEKAITQVIPKFLLTDTENSVPSTYDYAIHLFISLFDIRAKIMMWYLMREHSYERLISIRNQDSLEFFDSINSVLADRPSNLADCVKLAKNLFHRIFITNVEDANQVLIQMNRNEKRYPITDINTNIARKFILSTTSLFATMYDIKGQDDTAPTENELRKLIKETSYSPPTTSLIEGKEYKKPETFMDMMFLEHTMTLENISIQDPHDLADMVIQPIAPFTDNTTVKQFIESASMLRNFNFNNQFGDKRQIYAVGKGNNEFKMPYFRWAHKFKQLI